MQGAVATEAEFHRRSGLSYSSLFHVNSMPFTSGMPFTALLYFRAGGRVLVKCGS